jgi:hypothetical protein
MAVVLEHRAASGHIHDHRIQPCDVECSNVLIGKLPRRPTAARVKNESLRSSLGSPAQALRSHFAAAREPWPSWLVGKLHPKRSP